MKKFLRFSSFFCSSPLEYISLPSVKPCVRHVESKLSRDAPLKDYFSVIFFHSDVHLFSFLSLFARLHHALA